MAAAKSYGNGRSVFFGALPYDLTNSRLLHRAIFWAAGMEAELMHWFCSNPNTDCAWYPQSRKLVVVNHSDQAQTTTVFRGDGTTTRLTLKPHASKWMD